MPEPITRREERREEWKSASPMGYLVPKLNNVVNGKSPGLPDPGDECGSYMNQLVNSDDLNLLISKCLGKSKALSI